MRHDLASFEPILAVARHRSRGRVAFALVLAAFAFALTFAVSEGAARAFFWLRRNGALLSLLPCLPRTSLHEYQLWDAQRCVWRLKPHFMATLPESLENARKAGRMLGERHLRERPRELESPADGALV